MSTKDPRNAIERLTNALNAIATSPRDARQRCALAWSILVPLSADGFGPVFPQQQDKAMFDQIMETDATALDEEGCGRFLEMVWTLYWRMSDNEQYV